MTPSNSSSLLQQANYILDSCGRQTLPDGNRDIFPRHILYTRFLLQVSPGVENIGALTHGGRVPVMLRAVTAQALPRSTQGVLWRMRFPSGQYLQSEYTNHAMAFGFGSDRQAINPPQQWDPGVQLFIDLDTIIAGPPADPYSIAIMLEVIERHQIPGASPVRNPLDRGPMPRYFLNEPQNILAPEFRFGPSCPSETPAGYWDEEYCYVSPVVQLPSQGGTVSNVGTQIDSSEDFIVRQVWGNFPVGSTGGGNVTVRMRRGDGYALSSNFVPINAIQGAMFRELKVRASDQIYFDAQVVDGGGSGFVDFGLYFYGVKRRKI